MGETLKVKVKSKTFILIGTILVWIPLLTPIFFTSILLVTEGLFRFDFLMPAELFFFSFIGGIFLIFSSKGSVYRKIIIKSFIVALVALIGSQLIAEVSGLANGDIEPRGWQFMLVIGVYLLFVISQIVLGISGLQYYKSIKSEKLG